jgi:trk system potassium uptake protein TrkH
MQFGGGAGLVIIMLAAIVGPGGPGLSIAEGRTDQLVPNVRQSAKLVFTLYSAYILIGIIAYYLAGMTFFDAINHAIPAVSTGGFSTRVESIGYWNSPTIEAITIVLMIFGTLNFLTSYTLLRGKFSAFAKNGEVRLMVVLIPVFFFILLLFVCQNLYPTLEKSIRVAIFEPVSALSTTGFSTVLYNNWKSTGIFSLIILMLIGGGTCSTAGGIKQYRIYLLYKSIIWEIKRLLLPRNSIQENYIWQGDQKVYITDGTLRTIVAFVSLYMITYFTGSGILMLHGYSIGDSMFEFASSLGTVGLSIGITNLSAPALVLWTETIGMFLGRLEFFVIFVGSFKLVKDSFIMLKN